MSRTTNKRQWARDYPFTVEMPTPPGGHGRKLDAMLAWCKTHSRDRQVFGTTFYFRTEGEANSSTPSVTLR